MKWKQWLAWMLVFVLSFNLTQMNVLADAVRNADYLGNNFDKNDTFIAVNKEAGKTEDGSVIETNNSTEESSITKTNSNTEDSSVTETNSNTEDSSVTETNTNTEDSSITETNSNTEDSSVTETNTNTEDSSVTETNTSTEDSSVTETNTDTEDSSITETNTNTEDSSVTETNTSTEDSSVTETNTSTEDSSVTETSTDTEYPFVTERNTDTEVVKEERELEGIYQVSGIYINPIYQDILDEEFMEQSIEQSNFAVMSNLDGQICNSIAEAGTVLWKAMKQRDASVQMYCTFFYGNYDGNEAGLKADFTRVCDAIIDEAMKHTDVADEGAYFEYYGCVSSDPEVYGNTTITFNIVYFTTVITNEIFAEDIEYIPSNQQQMLAIQATTKEEAQLSYESNSSVITVDSAGVVTIPAGTKEEAIITITAAAGLNYGECSKTITVFPSFIINEIFAEDIEYIPSNQQQILVIQATTKEEATLSYQSNNSMITVDREGVVTIPAGTKEEAMITITAAAGLNYGECTKMIAIFPSTVEIEKEATAEEVLRDLSLNTLIKNISFKGTEIEGPVISMNKKSFPLFSLDVGLELKLGENVQAKVDTETKTIQVLIGFQDFSGSASLSAEDNTTKYWKESYQQVKDLYIGMTGRQVNTTALWNKFSKLRGKLKKINGLKMGIDGKAYAAGYIEFSYASGEIVYTSGGIVVEMGLGVTFDYKIPPFPIAYFTFGAEVDGDANLTFVRESEGCYCLKQDFGLDLNAHIGVGAGEKKINLYAEGGLKGKLHFGFSLPSETFAKAFTASLTGSVYFVSQVLGFEGPSYSNEFGNVTLFPKKSSTSGGGSGGGGGGSWTSNSGSGGGGGGSWTSSSGSGGESGSGSWSLKGTEKLAEEEEFLLDVSQMQPISREYLYTAAKSSSRSQSGRKSELFSLTNLYPYNKAHVVCLDDGTKILFWIGDMGTKSDVNKTSLCYSIYNQTTWSEPQVISDSGGLNDEPYIVSDGKSVSIVWQKTASAMPENSSLEEVLKAVDLYYMTYQDGVFQKAVKVTENQNTVYEMLPSLVVCKNQAMIAWVENSANDPFMTEGTNSIKKAVQKNGSWMVDTIAENLLAVDFCMAVSWCGKPAVLYGFDSEIYLKTDWETIHLEGNYAQVEKDLLYYEAGENLLVYDPAAKQSRETGLPAFDTTYTVTDLDGNPVISYVNYTGFTSELIAYRYNKERGNWSEWIRLSDDSKYIRNYQITTDKENHLIALFNLVDVNEEAEKIYGAAEIQMINLMEEPDVILEQAWFEEELVEPGAELPILFEVKNNSIAKISTLDAEILDENGAILGKEKIAVALEAGETGRFSLCYELPSDLVCHTIRLVVTTEGETALWDNEKELIIGNADIAVTGVTLNGIWSDASITGIVENIGYQTAEEVSVKVYVQNSKASEVSEEEEAITIMEEILLGTLLAGEQKDFMVVIPEEYRKVKKQAFGKDIFIEAQTETEQTRFSNDLVKYVIRSKEDAPFVLSQSEMVLKEGDIETLQISYSTVSVLEEGIEWSSSDPSVAIVEDGQITALHAGTAKIQATVNNTTAVCKLVVEEKQSAKVKGIYAKEQSINIKVGESVQLEATILPASAADTNLNWSSDQTEIAEVDPSGKVRGRMVGNAVITARAEGSSQAVQYQISVVQEKDFQDTSFEPEGRFEIRVSISGRGSVSGDGTYRHGDLVMLEAVEENSVFEGWYRNGMLVSLEKRYGFICTDTILLEARFKNSGNSGSGGGSGGSSGNSGSGGGSGGSSGSSGNRVESNRNDTVTSVTLSSGEWIQDSVGWWYRNADHSYPANQWQFINGKWYFFNKAGYMVTGWILSNDQWYYLGVDGAMIENNWVFYREHWYFLRSGNGDMATGWILWNNCWYYLNTDGSMQTGWFKEKEDWYYLNQNGELAVDGITPDGYKVDRDGRWIDER